MNRKSFVEYYGPIFGVDTFSKAYAMFKSLPKEEQIKHTKKRQEIARKASLEKNPDRYKNASDKLRGKKRDSAIGQKISNALKEHYANSDSQEKLSKAQKERYLKNPKSLDSIAKQRASLIKTYQQHPEIKEQISASVKAWSSSHPNEISEKTKAAMAVFYATEKGQENLKKWSAASRQGGHSGKEDEIAQFIKSIGFDVIPNDRKILNGKELDIFVPGKNVAIELNGLIWHSEKFKPDAMRCHLLKTQACAEKNIRLIHLFSDEWIEKPEICKSIIASALGVYQEKFFARELTVQEISPKAGTAFFKANHIAGSVGAEKYIALCYDNEIIQCASFGRNRFTKSNSTELLRMATKLNTQVCGGFSRIMAHSGYDTVESYVDLRLFNANGYVSSGWKIIGSSQPKYYYTDGHSRENRMKYMKQNCLKMWPQCSPELTEHEMCLQHGLFRIYDCGTLKLSYSN